MPSLQLDIIVALTSLQKQALAREMGEECIEIMGDSRHITVVIPALFTRGSTWDYQERDLVQGAILQCHQMKIGNRQSREGLAIRLADLVAARAAVPQISIKIQFTDNISLTTRAWKGVKPLRRIVAGILTAVGCPGRFSRGKRQAADPCASHPYTPLHMLTAAPWEGLYLERKQWRPYLPDTPSNLS